MASPHAETSRPRMPGLRARQSKLERAHAGLNDHLQATCRSVGIPAREDVFPKWRLARARSGQRHLLVARDADGCGAWNDAITIRVGAQPEPPISGRQSAGSGTSLGLHEDARAGDRTPVKSDSSLSGGKRDSPTTSTAK